MFGDLVLCKEDKRIIVAVTLIVNICVQGVLVMQSFESVPANIRSLSSLIFEDRR